MPFQSYFLPSCLILCYISSTLLMVWQVVVPQNISGPRCSSRNLPLSLEVESIFHPFEAGWDFVTSLWREWGGDASSCMTLRCKRDKIFFFCCFLSLGMLTFRAGHLTGKKLSSMCKSFRWQHPQGSQQTSRLHQQTFENTNIPAPSPGQPQIKWVEERWDVSIKLWQNGSFMWKINVIILSH